MNLIIDPPNIQIHTTHTHTHRAWVCRTLVRDLQTIKVISTLTAHICMEENYTKPSKMRFTQADVISPRRGG